MTDTIIDHGYVPEEHAPDPVIGHGDPTPPGKVAIWLFLASEIMFFVAILGSYIILRAGSHEMFSEHAAGLHKTLAGGNTLVLILSSLTMALAVDAAQKGQRGKLIFCLIVTFLCACGFMAIKTYEYNDKAHHFTVTAREIDSNASVVDVYDGHIIRNNPAEDFITLRGFRAPIEKVADQGSFDIHTISEKGLEEVSGAKEETEFKIPRKLINAQVRYGPWKNIFYSCYFTLTGIHGLHVIGGMIPIFFLLIHAIRGKILPAHTEYVGLYWHFVDLVWIFLFPLLYLV